MVGGAAPPPNWRGTPGPQPAGTVSRPITTFAGPLRWATWVALALALTRAYVSMVTLFWRHADLWTRAPVPMEMR